MDAHGAEGRIPIAVIGCGAIATRFHLPLLRERSDVELRAIVDPDTSRVEELAHRFEVPVVAADHTELSARGVRAAIVTVPNHLHAPVAVDLLEAGVHVLVEKPLAPTADACRAMIEAARRNARILVPALPFRFSGGVTAARRMLTSGLLGPVGEIRIAYGAGVGWPAATDHLLRREMAGGGTLLDLGSHVLDLVVGWFGDVEVVDYRDDSHGGVEADVLLELASPTGAHICVELSRTRDLDQTVTFVGERATLTAGIGTDRLELEVDGEIVAGPPSTSAGPARGHDLHDLFRTVHDDFFGAISTGRPTVLSAEDAARSIALIEACYAARRPLRLPWVTVDERSGPLAGKRVLVTGATGFIGGRVAEKLALEHAAEVRALIRSPATAMRLARLPIEFVRGAIEDPSAVDTAVQGCDVVINCAHDIRTSGLNHRSGVRGVEFVAEAALRAGVERLVHVSSAAVYGNGHQGDLTETSTYERAPNSYVASKQVGERLLARLHRSCGLPVVVIQPPIVYGPWGRVWTARIIEQLSAGVLALPDGGHGVCNAVYVDDLADAIVSAATADDVTGEVFLVSAAEPVSWRGFYAAFEAMVGHQAVLDVPSGLLPRLARRERRRTRRHLLRVTAGGLRRAVANPDTVATLQRLPAAQRTAGLLVDVLPAQGWEALKELVTGGQEPSPRYGYAAARKLIHVPSTDDTALYCSTARLRIDKARRLLGYRPRFDLDEGMRLTAEFSRWARLA
ncbi:NAD-dependent epimerase/dehydratase family protein [Nitriliruptor alkaliphilus]|uniref:NAD-dependent epimerase/dehydratase family protein n=1 Tax=Nitriliruptor alkaliphilus TaxID=427918 RepID=UPI0006990F5A|nr:NAD-dependent epimerase/dehydratase family protein [Nitriliruptor alkaliphilus]